MKISDLLKKRDITVSCELFPPKTGAALSKIDEVIQKTATLRPDFISVTYGAGGSTSKRTVEIASKVQKEFQIPSLAHFTCVSATRSDVAQMLSGLRAHGIENILALRGDIPQDAQTPPASDYRYAGELIAEIRSQGDFCIGAACYPEGHVECEHREIDLEHLKQKVESGCDFLTSQMFFDNNVFYHFLYRVLSKGIHIPVIAGVMPVINSRQIQRSCELSGTRLPPRFLAMADKFADDPSAMRQAGIAYATEQIIDLIAHGVNHIHIYTMNRPDIAGKIMENLSDIIRPAEAGV